MSDSEQALELANDCGVVAYEALYRDIYYNKKRNN